MDRTGNRGVSSLRGRSETAALAAVATWVAEPARARIGADGAGMPGSGTTALAAAAIWEENPGILLLVGAGPPFQTRLPADMIRLVLPILLAAALLPSLRAQQRGMAVEPLDEVVRGTNDISAGGSSGLFVGVGAFDAGSNLGALKYAPDDAVALAHLFTLELGLIPVDRARVALSGTPRSQRGNQQLAALKAAGVRFVGADKNALLGALRQIKAEASQEDGLIVVSVATHGFEDGGGQYLMPSNGLREEAATTGIPLNLVKQRLQEASARKRILLLDACREAVEGGTRGAETATAGLQESFRKAEGFAVLGSCSAKQLSWESDELQQGVFTHHFVQALKGGVGGSPSDGLIRLGDVAQWVAVETAKWARVNRNVAQEPWTEGEIARQIPLAVDTRTVQRLAAVQAAEKERARVAMEQAAQSVKRRREAVKRVRNAQADHEKEFPRPTLDAVEKALGGSDPAKVEEVVRRIERHFAKDAVEADDVVDFLNWWKPRQNLEETHSILDSLRIPDAVVRRDEPGPAAEKPPAEPERRPPAAAVPETRPTPVPPATNASLALRHLVIRGNTESSAAPTGSDSDLEGGEKPPGAIYQRLQSRPTRESPYENSLGMRFVPATSGPLLVSVWETRVRDYAAYAKANSGIDAQWKRPVLHDHPVTPTNTSPVVYVSWEDARRFCEWLTRKEQSEERIPSKARYRLPTDREWSQAAGLKESGSGSPSELDGKPKNIWPFGNQWPPKTVVANLGDRATAVAFEKLGWESVPGYDDGFPTTAPVGSFPASASGIHDLSGNVREWVEDAFRDKDTTRVMRGGAWYHTIPDMLWTSRRQLERPTERDAYTGFRVVLEGVVAGK